MLGQSRWSGGRVRTAAVRAAAVRRVAVRTAGVAAVVAGLLVAAPGGVLARTQKPALYARKWLAITGKPLAASAGARIFERGGRFFSETGIPEPKEEPIDSNHAIAKSGRSHPRSCSAARRTNRT